MKIKEVLRDKDFYIFLVNVLLKIVIITGVIVIIVYFAIQRADEAKAKYDYEAHKITSGTVIDKQDYVIQRGKEHIDNYVITYENVNDLGEKQEQKAYVTYYTYTKYNIGDWYETKVDSNEANND